MDEPTSSLTLTETERLLEVIADLKAHCVSVIYTPHRLAEVKACADRVVVLRDGKRVGDLARDDISHGAMIRLMIGRDLKALYIPPKDKPARERRGAPRSCDRGLSRSKRLPGDSARRDPGTGRSDRRGPHLARPDPVRRGSARSGRFGWMAARSTSARRKKPSPRASISCRKTARSAGLLLDMSIAENISLADLSRYTRLLLIRAGEEQRVAQEQRASLAIKTPSVETKVVTSSGGNSQQKVAPGKRLSMKPNVTILDEPTRGIDVGAKSADLCADARFWPIAVSRIPMVSSDMEEVIGVSDLNLPLMHEGRISGFLAAAPTFPSTMSCCLR
jgi:ribose transport system ATP-binding protein